MGDGCHLGSSLVHFEHVIGTPAASPITCHEQRHGGHAHDAAAALAIVVHLFALEQIFTGRKAGISRSAAVSQFGKVAEPCYAGTRVFARLRIVPVQVGFIHIFLRPSADASRIAACHAHQHTAGCKERHLRVIADQCLAFSRQVKFRNAPEPIFGENAPAAHKLHRITQRIACRACHQRTAYAVACPHFQVILSASVDAIHISFFCFNNLNESCLYPINIKIPV